MSVSKHVDTGAMTDIAVNNMMVGWKLFRTRGCLWGKFAAAAAALCGFPGASGCPLCDTRC